MKVVANGKRPIAANEIGALDDGLKEPNKLQRLLQLIRDLDDRELEIHRDLVDGEIERRKELAARLAARARSELGSGSSTRTKALKRGLVREGGPNGPSVRGGAAERRASDER